jgi:sec-independent protein translocase protein TatB
MFGIGFTEIVIILTIALIAFGPEKLPELMKVLGKTFGEFKKATQDLQKSVDEVKEDIVIEEPLTIEEDKGKSPGEKDKEKSPGKEPER